LKGARYRRKGEGKKRRMGDGVRRRRIPTYQLSYKLEKYLSGNQRWPNNLEADRYSG
jgi:hypothetical protein